MFLFIALIVGLIAYFSLSNRISRIEKHLRAGGLSPRINQEIRQEAGESAMSSPQVHTAPLSVDQLMHPQVPSDLNNALNSRQNIFEKKESGEDTGGKMLGKIGAIAILAGVSFFLKYAFDSGLIGETGRIILGFISGVIILGIGQWLRKKYERYSDILIGCALGVLYLTIYAAFIFYDLITSPVAFFLMIAVTALSVVMSVVDKTPVIARLGILGGFLTPIFMSFSGRTPVDLLAYILILDLGVVAAAYFYKWMSLKYVAFVGTVITYFGWVNDSFMPEDRGIVLIFVILYWLCFLVASILHHIVRKEKTNEVDMILIILNAAIFGGALIYSLLEPVAEDFLGYIAVLMALLYFIIGYISYLSNKEDKYLNIALPAISVVYLTLAIPLHFEGSWITVAWIAEALMLYLICYSVKGKNLYFYGGVVYLIGLVRFFSMDNWRNFSYETFSPILNERFYMLLFMIAVLYLMALISRKGFKETGVEIAREAMIVAIVAAQFLTIYAGTTEINNHYNKINFAIDKANQEQYQKCLNLYQDDPTRCFEERNSLYESTRENRNSNNTAVSIFWTVYAILLMVIGFAMRIKLLRIAGLILFFVTAVKIFIDVWSLGYLYRIISSIVFGVLALIGSFLYAKYKERINEAIK